MLKVCVIGLGDVASMHLDALTHNPLVRLAGACDIDQSRENIVPEGVLFYTDYREMIKEIKPDAVHILLPHYMHVPMTLEMAKLGIHVFLEKPLGLNVGEALQLIEYERKHPDIYIGVCLQNRLNDTTVKLKEIIDGKTYGKILGIRGTLNWSRPAAYYDLKPWRGKLAAAGGGCLVTQAIHTLDLLYYLAGKVDSVRASVAQLLDYGVEVEDTVSSVLYFKNGARGFFEATIANYKNESPEIAVKLEKAEFTIRDNSLYEGSSPYPLASDKRPPGPRSYYGTSHSRAIDRFYRAVTDKSENYMHGRDALYVMKLIDAIQKSGKSHKSEKIAGKEELCIKD